jgi:hypothetical protein
VEAVAKHVQLGEDEMLTRRLSADSQRHTGAACGEIVAYNVALRINLNRELTSGRVVAYQSFQFSTGIAWVDDH